MRPHQHTTGRYQLIDGPWEHLNGSSVDLDQLELRWFDQWLKHEHTGIAHTHTPLHYYDLGTGKFRETTTYPFTRSKATHFYLGPHHTLHRTKRHQAGKEAIAWSSSGSPCGRSIDQWAMGGISIPAHMAGFMAPCGDDDRTTHNGPSAVMYTTKKFHHAQTIAGPIVANVYAKSTTPEAQWVAEVEEVTSSGASYPITEGALLGSLRAVKQSKSWRSHGVTTLPYHPYTKRSARPVKVGKLTRYQIEIFPTLVTIGKGDRLRLTLSTSDSPHLTPLPAELPQLSGGVYTITHSRAKPSSLIVELRRP
jgi:putative CocE/NonD family hydrolase